MGCAARQVMKMQRVSCVLHGLRVNTSSLRHQRMEQSHVWEVRRRKQREAMPAEKPRQLVKAQLLVCVCVFIAFLCTQVTRTQFKMIILQSDLKRWTLIINPMLTHGQKINAFTFYILHFMQDGLQKERTWENLPFYWRPRFCPTPCSPLTSIHPAEQRSKVIFTSKTNPKEGHGNTMQALQLPW